MPKNTTQCPRPGLEPRPLAPESSALTMRPPRLPRIICNKEKYQMVKVCFRILNSCNLVGERIFDLKIIKIRDMHQKRSTICFSGYSSSGALFSFLLANNHHHRNMMANNTCCFSTLFLSAASPVIDD